MHGDFIINLLYHRVLLPEVTSEVSIGQDFMQCFETCHKKAIKFR